MRTATIGLSAALLSLAAACASGPFVAADGRYHLELAPRMGVREGNGRLVADHFDLDARITISSFTTEINDLDTYVTSELDPTMVAAADRDDTLVGPLSAVRLEFQGGVDFGRGLPVEPNLVVYLIMDGATVYQLSCTAPDGPFDSFCSGPFDDMVASFGPGPGGS